MRKNIIGIVQPEVSVATQASLDLTVLAQAFLSSEANDAPIEAALSEEHKSGWRAASPGEQLIRFEFDQPQRIQQIHLVFTELLISRTQEFLLRWAHEDDHFQEILHQQFHFSPPTTTVETETYTVQLAALKYLELLINPDISQPEAFASLQYIRLV